MNETPAPQKTSSLKVLLYIILGVVLVSVFLEMTGMADVAGKREHEQIIDRPHE